LEKKYIFLSILLYLLLLVFFYHTTHNYALNQVDLRVKEFLKNYQSLRTYVSTHQKSEVFRLQHEKIIDKDYFSPNLLSSTFASRTVNEFYNTIRKFDNKKPIQIKFASKNARNPLNQATLKEAELLDKYNSNILKEEYKEILKLKDGTFYYYVLPTVKNEKKCMQCHSTPQKAPKDLIAMYGNENGFYEKEGYMRAILTTTVNIDEDIVFANKIFLYFSFFTTLVFGIIFFIVHNFTKKLEDKISLVSSILDSQKSIVILTNGKKIIQGNKSFLKFFQIDSFEEFLKEHNCICDFFIKKDGFFSNDLLEDTDKNWISYMLKLDNDKKIVLMKNKQNNKDEVFLVSFEEYEDGSHKYVINFTNITELNELQSNLQEIVFDKTKELLDINTHLEEKIKLEVDKNREKDRQLYESAKMVQMAEMVKNISHQWRQPLSTISTMASSIKLKYEINDFDINEVLDYMDKIVKNTQILSDILDTFRDFVQEKNETKTVLIQDKLDKTLRIIRPKINENKIKLINKIDYTNPVEITMLPTDLSQVVINIFNNAQEILLLRKIKDPWIKISMEIKVGKSVKIIIEDNGGGIDENIIPKIFDPYFTTKHQSQGTGLGLHLSYTIITKSLGGKLYVENGDEGARFFIELPLIV
jgi:signal transduction histidine kinase